MSNGLIGISNGKGRDRIMEENNVDAKEGKLEKLEKQAKNLLMQSKDQFFTEYLQKLIQRIQNQKYQADLLQDELDRSYEMYLHRMKLTDAGNSTAVPPVQLAEQAAPNVQEKPAEQAAPNVQEEPAEQPQPNAQEQPAGQPVKSVPVMAAPKRNMEFAIGAALLSILGGAFILTSLVMLGMHFMNGLIKGMSLFAVFGVLILISECFIYRRLQKLGTTLTAIGIGGLYLSNVLNYAVLHNYVSWIAMIITLIIVCFMIFISRKRDSAAIRILGMIAGSLSFLMYRFSIDNTNILVLTVIMLVMQIALVAVPVKKHAKAAGIAQIYTNMGLTLLLGSRATIGRIDAWDEAMLPKLVFLFSSMVVLQLIYIVLIRSQKKQNPAESNTSIVTAYLISGIIFCMQTYSALYKIDDSISGYSHIAMIAIAVLCLLTWVFLYKEKEKWFAYYLLNSAVFVIYIYSGAENGIYEVPALLILLVLGKLLSMGKIPQLRALDAVVTALVCIDCIYFVADNTEYVYSLLFLAGVVLSILFIKQWRLYYAIILTATLGICAMQLPNIVKLPAVTGILFAGILLFNQVKKWRSNNIMVYNGLALVGQIVCFLALAQPIYRNAYITYLCMLIFGLATIVLTFRKEYQMDWKFKQMSLAVFLTYMALVVRINQPFVNSILLMLVALISVGLGFAQHKKIVRIYGLILSLFVCGKVVLYDFMDAPSLQKTLLFFVVGVIALIIAGIYIFLEKKAQDESSQK